MSPKGEEQRLAFERIHQAIREDDLWLSAWWMSKFVKNGYRLNKEQIKRLDLERKYRSDNARDSVLALETLAAKNARLDFEEWLQKGTPFHAVVKTSEENCRNGLEARRLRAAIATYSCAAGYIEEIIKMGKVKKTKPKANGEGPEVVEMEAMGVAPSAETFSLENLNDEDWIIIRKEEAQRGNFVGMHWSVPAMP